MSNNKMIDMSYLISVCGDDADFKQEMIDTFLRNTPPVLEDMKSSLSEKDWKKIGDLAHKIKPSFTFMGISKAKDLIVDIEHSGRNNTEIEDIRDKIEQLNKICIQAFNELKEELKTH